MNRKLISLAVAAALVAPAAAMADAVLYGKMNVSLDYVDVDNVILPIFNDTNVVQNVGFSVYPANWPNVSLRGQPVPNPLTGVVNTSQVNPPAPNSTRPVNPGGEVVAGKDYQGWGMANGYVPNAVTYVFVPAGLGNGGVVGQQNPGTGAVLGAAGMPAPLVVASQGGGRANRVGVKGSEELGGGLKAIYQIEFGINPTDTNNNLVNNADTIAMRNTFVGLAGGFGTALMGRHDTPLKISTGKLDFFADTLADMNATVGFHDLRADNAVAYISPSFSGFTLAAAMVPAGGGTALGTTNTESDSINEGWSIAGIYSNGPFYASAAYESLGYELFNTNANNPGCPGYVGICTTSGNDWNKWRFGLGLLDWNGFSLSAIYENQTGIAGSDAFLQGTAFDQNGRDLGYSWVLPMGPNNMELWQIQAGYSFGASMIKAMYGATSFDSDGYVANPLATARQLQQQSDVLTGDRSTWAVGYDYNFSKRTKAYALYTEVSDDRKDWVAGSEWSGFSLGMMHSF
jgi:predicted porin